MPAMLDDPTSPPIARMCPLAATPSLIPKHLTLKDGTTEATLLPFISLSQVPPALVAYLCETFATEVQNSNTYPMLDSMSLETFGPYWFGLFAAVMLLGKWQSVDEVIEKDQQGGMKWDEIVLGSFYVKPNYPGRSSHVCNAGFLVTPVRRNQGVGKLMGKTYLEWAPKLGYSYSVFNLVYETNAASLRIWDSLGFERIGRVKKCGQLKSFPGRRIDAIIYGYDFEPDAEI